MKKAYKTLLSDSIFTVLASYMMLQVLDLKTVVIALAVFTICCILLIAATAIVKPFLDTFGLSKIKLLSVKHTAIHSGIVCIVAWLPLLIKIIIERM